MTTKTCIDCTKDLPIEDFYDSKGHEHNKMVYCKTCFNKRCTDRWTSLKIKAIHYKGGSCSKCSLALEDSHYAVFDFHHLDPSTKEFAWTKLRLRPWSVITKELDKCILLCANCHRLEHAQ